MTDTPPPAPPSTGPSPTAPPPPAPRPTARTRISTAWLAVVGTALVIVLLLVFILQNTRSVKVSFFTANGHLPLGVALLVAALGGVLLTAAVASLRIIQLRRRAKPAKAPKPATAAAAPGGKAKTGGRLWHPGRHQVGT